MTNIAILPVISAAAITSQDGDAILAIGFSNSETPIDLTGIAWSLQWNFASPNGTVDTNQSLLSASTAGSYLTTGNSTGIIRIDIPVSKLLGIPVGLYQADLIATGDGKTIVVGTITFTHSQMGLAVWTSLTTAVRDTAAAKSVAFIAIA